MAQEHVTHEGHSHTHGTNCGHTAVRHDGHIDYLHDGHLHHMHGDHVDEHRIAISDRNPERCTPNHGCGEHERGHKHGINCGHPQIPHGDHIDYLVGGHLHHEHGTHCDDHGAVELASASAR